MATTEKAKEVAVKQSNMLAVASKALLELEAEEECYEDASDFEIPMIKLMQGLSDFVKEGKAGLGDYCSSMSGEILAKRNEKLELILLKKEMYYNEFDESGDEKKYIGRIPYTAETANLPYEDEHSYLSEKTKGLIKRYKTVDWYVLKADPTDNIFAALPYVFRFQVSSLKVAKNLNSKLQVLKRQGIPRAAKVFEFTSKINPTDQHKNLIPEITLGRDVTPSELEAATMWTKDLMKMSVKVVDKGSDTSSDNEESEVY